jgi:hypothetical protein
VKEEQGMLLIMLDGFDIPLIVRKSDGNCLKNSSTYPEFILLGGYGYDSTDMAAIYYRLKDLDR